MAQTEDYNVKFSYSQKVYQVRATSHLAAGWTATQNRPGDVRGTQHVQFVARVGHPYFHWEGLLAKGDDLMYCRVGYDVAGERFTQDLVIRAQDEAEARRFCGLRPEEIKSFEAQYRPFKDHRRQAIDPDDDWSGYGLD